ncbi:MAG: transcriptional regulator [uncultured bacterium]|nr:MAG: transcriptional regulator [uncultured bacterium]
MYTISKLASLHNLSRSTLLYYDSIGLLSPSKRTEAKYRLYSEKDRERLALIRTYAETGLSLENILKIINTGKTSMTQILEGQLGEINQRISLLRNQQQIIIKILKKNSMIKKIRAMNKNQWSALLRLAGLDEEGMITWHVEFEKMAPEAHQDFLESLNISKEEIRHIRNWSKNAEK